MSVKLLIILPTQSTFSFISAGIFHQTFTSLQHIKPEVLYPIPDFSAFQKPIQPASDDLVPSGEKLVFLSINRYERKKNLALAIKAFGKIASVRKVVLDKFRFSDLCLCVMSQSV